MSNDMTENDHLEALGSIEITPQMETVINNIMDTVDGHINTLSVREEKIAVGMYIAQLMTATTFANALMNQPYLIDAVLEKFAEDIHDAVQTLLANNETLH